MITFAVHAAAAEETVALCLQNRIDERQRFVAVRADIGSDTDRTSLLEKTLKEFGRLDALVNNAGIGPMVRTDITQMSQESFDEVLRVNLRGSFFLTQTVANYWLHQKLDPILKGGFKIVFISSVSAEMVSLNRGEYCISKAGVAMAAKLWALRLADQGVQVFEVRPGIMATDMTSGAKEKYDRLLEEGLVPQRRWGTPEDVGLAVISLVSGDFPFTTGGVIYVDGGLNLQRF